MSRTTARLALTLILLAAVAVGQSVVRAHPDTRPDSRYLVLVVLDGFRPDYLTLAPMHHLHQLMDSGMTYRRAWVGQIETETPTGHASIVTGVYPRKHNVIGFGWRDSTGQGFTWMPTDLRQLNAGVMETQIEAGGPTVSDMLHRSQRSARSASISGEKYYAADAMGTGADYILYGGRVPLSKGGGLTVQTIGVHVPPPATHYRSFDLHSPAYPYTQDQWVARLGADLARTVRPRMLLLNFPGTDIEGHITGGAIDRPAMAHMARAVDSALGMLVSTYRHLGILDRTDFVITADHGMLPNRRLVPIHRMYAGVKAAGAATIESDFLTTGGYVYLRDPDAARSVAASLEADDFPGVDGALYRTGSRCAAGPRTADRLPRNLVRAYLDLCATAASSSGPDVLLPYAEDTMGLHVAGAQHWGNHGGFSWRVQHIPLVMAGPGIRHGVSSYPAELVDLAPTMERLLGLQVPSSTDGIVLRDALTAGRSDDAAHQANVGTQRAADVEALASWSRSQHGVALAGSW